MSTTFSHRTETPHTAPRAPLLAAAAVLGIVAVGAVAGVSLQQHAGDATPTAPDPPVVSYPGSSVFDNQPTGPTWTRRDDFKRPGRTVLSGTE